MRNPALKNPEQDVSYRWHDRNLFLLFCFWWWGKWKSEIHHSYELFSILEPISICWSGIFTPWICFGLNIIEVLDRFRKNLQKEGIVTYKSKKAISGIYPKFSEHSFCTKTRDSFEAFEEVGESIFRWGHDFLGYSVSGILESLDIYSVALLHLRWRNLSRGIHMLVWSQDMQDLSCRQY